MPLILLVLLLGTATISLVWRGVCSTRPALAATLRIVEACAGTAWFLMERPAELSLLAALELLFGIALVSAPAAILVARGTERSEQALRAMQVLLVLALLSLELRS